MQYNYDYFISYAHKDNVSEDGKPGFVDEFVKKLLDSKENRMMFGRDINVFFDKSEINNMSDWDNRIRSSLACSRFLIVLLSPNYFKSEYCAKEFDWWMKHEMHRCTLGEGTAPMIIRSVGVFDPKIEPAPDISPDLQIRFPNWLKQIQTYQSDSQFDMHDFHITRIDEVLRTLSNEVKDKVRRQEIVDSLPYDTYPGYNENFVGRRENLLSLRDYLTTKSGKVITALTGLGGFGKTELALTYGHAFGWDYQLGRFFKPCENCHSISEALLSCGILKKYGWEPKGTDEEQLLFLFDHLKEERNKIIRRNTEAGNLRTEGAHLLIILDNVNNRDLIAQLLKLNLPDFIHIVITTRENTRAYTDIHTETVERLSEDESVELLSNLRVFDNPAEAEAARKIAKLLAGFTLIVELTGAYLAQNKENKFVTYQSQYDRLVSNPNHVETFLKMAEKTGDLTRHAAQTVATVMESTLSALSPNAREALDYLSLMSPDAAALGWIHELLELDEDDEYDVICELTSYSLAAQLENEPNVARIHRLVAETVKQKIPEYVQEKISSKIREKCNELLVKDKTFWYTSENSWNVTPVSEYCLALAQQWTVESSEEEIDWNLTWMFSNSGNILSALGKMNEAIKLFQRDFEICEQRVKKFPSNVSVLREFNVPCSRLGDLENSVRNAAAARMWYEKVLQNLQRLADESPNDAGIQRDLSVPYERLGDLEKAAGNLAAALTWYEKSLMIRHRLAEMAPNNVGAQQDLSAMYNRLGDLEFAAGDVAAARAWHEKDLEIRQRLADMAPDDVEVLQNLSNPYERLGELEIAVGNAAAARIWFQKALKIYQQLAYYMPADFGIQKNLCVLYERIADLEKAVGNADTARECYEKALRIAQPLADKLPNNFDAQLELSVLYECQGDLENAVGNAAAAWSWFEKTLKIRQRLVDKAPDDVDVLRGLGLSYEQLGNLQNRAGNFDVARTLYNNTLKIRQRLADMAPNNPDAMRDLSFSYNELGDLEQAAGNADAARSWFEKALEIYQRLNETAPENVTNLKNFGVLHNKIGDLEQNAGNVNAALSRFEKAQEIWKRLSELMPEDTEYQHGLCVFYKKLGDLEKEAENITAARDWYEKALDITQKFVDLMPEDYQSQHNLSFLYGQLGDIEQAVGNAAAALERYKKALEICKPLVDKMPGNVGVKQFAAILQTIVINLERNSSNEQ
ncbi:MAG: tetratricopeptide repeat protein [Thermoguttaceae bacterium]|nr:tetratricopeptide repeat protein [Thermoguttaceae bacterium]